MNNKIKKQKFNKFKMINSLNHSIRDHKLNICLQFHPKANETNKQQKKSPSSINTNLCEPIHLRM